MPRKTFSLLMTTSTAKRIAIVGGGFSGVMAAVNLARLGLPSERITLINHRRPTGRGVAYGTRRMEHLLNVSARNMSAFPDQPDHLVEWLRTRSEFDLTPDHELRERFIPRMIYGDYLRSLMLHHLPDMRQVAGEATDIDAHGTIQLADGSAVDADRVVLATGNEPPADSPGAESLIDHPAWAGNPWLPWQENLPPDTGTVILLGTGLTTIDAIITLRSVGWLGRIFAVSRHGWLPHAHFRGIDYPAFPPADVPLEKLGLAGLVDLMEQHCANLRGQGANPAIIVDRMRPHTQRIWKNFSIDERLRFAREFAARWNILRHRIAPEIHAQVAGSQLTGQLQVRAAGIERVQADGDRVRVDLSTGDSLTGDLVVNATGPRTEFTATGSTLLQNLMKRGLVAPDDMNMGLRVAEDHRVALADGSLSERLLALGPLLRGTLWETIAVPELRVQARRTAETLLGQAPSEVAEPEVMMEYMI